MQPGSNFMVVQHNLTAMNSNRMLGLTTKSQAKSTEKLSSVPKLEFSVHVGAEGNLDNIVENTTSAESQIRDTDMATEMVRYSNNQILAQAGQAMLAQANQSNQGVLSLLG